MSKDSTLTSSARERLFSHVASMQKPDKVEAPELLGMPAANARFTDFTTLPGYSELQFQQSLGEKLDLRNPYFRIHEGRLGPRTRIEGANCSISPVTTISALTAIPKSSRLPRPRSTAMAFPPQPAVMSLASGPVHRSLERALAELYQADDALLFVSGYATNVGVIGQLAGPKDLVISDAAVHNSAVMGSVLSGAARRSFAHNDLENLEQILSTIRNRFERVLIVVEGLYSMDGDYPELPRLIEIKKRFHAWLMIDEAHALGVMGRRGYGIAEHFGVDPRAVDIWMGTVSKTLAGCGGYIAGSAALVDYLRLMAGAFVYSVGMPPVIAASVEKALEIMQREPERVARLQANGGYFRNYAKKKGLDTGAGRGLAVAPVIVGDSIATVMLSQELFQRGVNVLPVLYPAVPVKTSRLRFFLTAMHSEQDIENAIDTTVEVMAQLPERLRILKAVG